MTFLMKASGRVLPGSYSTTAFPLRKLASAEMTPSTPFRSRSTAPEHRGQTMPLTRRVTVSVPARAVRGALRMKARSRNKAFLGKILIIPPQEKRLPGREKRNHMKAGE